LALLVLFGTSSCSIVGAKNNAPPERSTLEGLQFSVSTSLVRDTTVAAAPANALEARLTVENVSDTTISREFPGGCMMSINVYKEGDWSSPSWTSDGTVICKLDKITVVLGPAERLTPPPWNVNLPIKASGIADALDPGMYQAAGVLHPDVVELAPEAEVLSPQVLQLTSSDLAN